MNQVFCSGETVLNYTSGNYKYTGELDDKGKATGKGIAVNLKNTEQDQNDSKENDKPFVVSLEGTFMNGWPHGVCRFRICSCVYLFK